MEINVVNIIIDSLMANGKCSIEGLGTFILNKSTAVIDAQSDTYIAPSKTIVFTDKVHTDHSLSDELLRVYPFSEAKSNKIVRQFSNKVLNGLINFDQVKLKNLGRIKSKKKGIEFEISNTLQEILDASSPSVDLKPFKDAVANANKANAEAEKAKIEEEKAADAAANANRVNAEAEKARIEKVKAADAAAKLAESKRYSERLVTEKETIPPVLPSTVAPETVVPELKTPPPVIEQPKPEAKAVAASTSSGYNASTPPPVKKEGFWSMWLPWILLFGLLCGLIWGIGKIVKLSKNSSATQSIDDNVKVADGDEISVEEAATIEDENIDNRQKEEGEGNDIEDAATPVQETKTKPTTGAYTNLTECVIITGAYRKQHNIDTMVSKIKGAGYDVYTEPSGHYTRVGFTFNCENKDLQAVIDEVRLTITKDAWYLVPDVEM